MTKAQNILEKIAGPVFINYSPIRTMKTSWRVALPFMKKELKGIVDTAKMMKDTPEKVPHPHIDFLRNLIPAAVFPGIAAVAKDQMTAAKYVPEHLQATFENSAWLVFLEVKVHAKFGYKQLEKYRKALDLSKKRTALITLTKDAFESMGESTPVDYSFRWIQLETAWRASMGRR